MNGSYSLLSQQNSVRVNDIEFAVMKLLHNPVFMQKGLFVNNCCRKHNLEKCHR